MIPYGNSGSQNDTLTVGRVHALAEGRSVSVTLHSYACNSLNGVPEHGICLVVLLRQTALIELRPGRIRRRPSRAFDYRPEFTIRVNVQFTFTNFSLIHTRQQKDYLGAEWSRTVNHDRVQKADRQPDSDTGPNRVTVDETTIRVGGERYCVFDVTDLRELDPSRSAVSDRTTQFASLPLRELQDEQQVSDVAFLDDEALGIGNVLDRLGVRLQVCLYEDRPAIKRIFCEVVRQRYLFSNRFPNAAPPTAESWREASAVWWTRY